VLAAGDRIRASALYAPALTLVLLGVFTKSAQWPFHVWLPRAMAAPTPASAYLHSATMVKAGVFLLARLHPALAGTDAWVLAVGGAGMITLLFGAYAALWQHDLKGLLAYSTISHLGLITMLLGFGTATAVAAAIFHVVNHATFKASLFMAAGIVDHEAGTRDMRVLNGLARRMPYTAALAIVAAAAMAGVPLLNGFLSKEMFFTEALDVSRPGGVRWVEPAAALLYGALSVGYSARFVMEVFFNADGKALPKTPHEPPRVMRLPVELLVAICIVVGVFPAAAVGPRAVRRHARRAAGAFPRGEPRDLARLQPAARDDDRRARRGRRDLPVAGAAVRVARAHRPGPLRRRAVRSRARRPGARRGGPHRPPGERRARQIHRGAPGRRPRPRRDGRAPRGLRRPAGCGADRRPGSGCGERRRLGAPRRVRARDGAVAPPPARGARRDERGRAVRVARLRGPVRSGPGAHAAACGGGDDPRAAAGAAPSAAAAGARAIAEPHPRARPPARRRRGSRRRRAHLGRAPAAGRSEGAP
jgi:hypothetical protein